jgi:hypothetical protein
VDDELVLEKWIVKYGLPLGRRELAEHKAVVIEVLVVTHQLDISIENLLMLRRLLLP